MKRLPTLFVFALFTSTILAQETVSVQPGYTHETFYSLTNGTVSSSPIDSWDLAFEIQGFSASIRINSAIGVKAYPVPSLGIADWASVDTAGISSWEVLNNSDESWTLGALNRGLDPENDFDLGWGVYNPITHAVTGDSLYVLSFPGNIWRKLRINDLASGIYSFTTADLDGSNEVTRTIAKADFIGKNFGYYSISGDSLVDQEPPAADWDLVFHKYVGVLTPGVYYGVTGVQSDYDVTVAKLAGKPTDEVSMEDTTGLEFLADISAIGFDWKSIDMSTFSWKLQDSLTYFVKTGDEQIFQLVFTGFGGSQTGEFSFNQTNLTNSITLNDGTIRQVAVAPNPVLSTINVILDLQQPAPTTIEVLDLSGRKVYAHSAGMLSGFQQVSFERPGLPAGIYLLRVTAAESIVTEKIQLR